MEIEWVISPIVFVSNVTLYTLYIALLSYYLVRYLQLKKTEFISKRYPLISFIEVMSIILTIGINFTIITFCRCIPEDSILYIFLQDFIIFSQPITLYAALYCLLWRCWHFYYDAVLNKQLKSAWTTIITQKALNDWYSNHQSTFGSLEYIGKRIFVMYLISCCISISAQIIIDSALSLFIDSLLFSVPCILFLVLYHKAPKGTENVLQINNEMKRVHYIVLSSLLSYLTLIILMEITDNDKYQRIFGIAAVSSTAFFLFIVSMVHTQWVLSYVGIWMSDSLESLTKSGFNLHNRTAADSSRYRLFTENIKERVRRYRKHKIDGCSSGSEQEHDESILHKRNVREVFENKKTFNLFVGYLNTEYSIECVLAFIELMQFQIHVWHHYPDSKSDELMMMEFNDYVPKSQIVDHDVESKTDAECSFITIKQKAYYLYLKYIATTSPYQVNISFHLRNRFKVNMADYDEWINGDDNGIDVDKLLLMFNMVSAEMYQLLSFSLSRFKTLLRDEHYNQEISRKEQMDFSDVIP